MLIVINDIGRSFNVNIVVYAIGRKTTCIILLHIRNEGPTSNTRKTSATSILELNGLWNFLRNVRRRRI